MQPVAKDSGVVLYGMVDVCEGWLAAEASRWHVLAASQIVFDIVFLLLFIPSAALALWRA